VANPTEVRFVIGGPWVLRIVVADGRKPEALKWELLNGGGLVDSGDWDWRSCAGLVFTADAVRRYATPPLLPERAG
jgi:hypothetical protein